MEQSWNNYLVEEFFCSLLDIQQKVFAVGNEKLF